MSPRIALNHSVRHGTWTQMRSFVYSNTHHSAYRFWDERELYRFGYLTVMVRFADSLVNRQCAG